MTKGKVIFDQDTTGIIGPDVNPLIMLLQADNVDILGVTVVSGNGWLKQQVADVLKVIELMNRPEIPIYPGAEVPLISTREEKSWSISFMAGIDWTHLWGAMPKTIHHQIS